MTEGALIYWSIALALGAAAGVAFLLAWRFFLPPGTQSRFWNALSALGLKAITVDEVSEFLATYRRLFVALGGYLGRNLAIAAVGGTAMVGAILFLLAPLQTNWDRQSATLTAASSAGPAPMSHAGDALVFARPGQRVTVTGDDVSVRIAACGSGDSCGLLEWLGFTIAPRSGPPTQDRTVIVRASHGDRNPLWPFLSDLEAVFGLGLLVSPLAIFFLPKQHVAASKAGFQLKASDFALVQINEQLKPVVRWVGDLESRTHRATLDAIPLDRPIFVTGLARSGTTTVLAALTRSGEVGSHQYRDFPFLGAPLTWSRLQGTLGKPVEAVERPHKDRILITSASPDAFEEPLWRQFFPAHHEVGVNQRLTADLSHPKFEAFYRDHLRKILLLRGAGRYVSKGNYNVGRIEYLAKLFPDAMFVVPVRRPLEHVASLCRQHALFAAYGEADPRVPLYLAAAGHFEFGLQRRPLVLSDGGAMRQSAFARGDDILGYAQQWAEVYGHVTRLIDRPELSGRILLVRYEDLCADPKAGLDQIIALGGLADADGAICAYADEISISPERVPAEISARHDALMAVVGDVARRAGYTDL